MVTIPREVAANLPSGGVRGLSFLRRMIPKTLCGERALINSLCARIRPKMPFTTAIRPDHACLAKSSSVAFPFTSGAFSKPRPVLVLLDLQPGRADLSDHIGNTI